MKKETLQGLHESLNKEGYLCNSTFTTTLAQAVSSRPVGGAFLFGPAGTGKSFLPMQLAKVLNHKLFFYGCTPGTREDDLLLKMIPNEDTKSGIKIEESVVYKAAKESQKNKVILVLDEWDKTRPTADGFFLDFLQYGRLTIAGQEIHANLNNMLIFFTSNNERDISEALIRRFPKIDMEPIPTKIVAGALTQTHDGHEALGNALALYDYSIKSKMSKPATIQELRQLLDAIDTASSLNKETDWDELVYTFVTKTFEDHELLRQTIDSGSHARNAERSRLNTDAFDNLPEGMESEAHLASMPNLIDLRNYDISIPDVDVQKDITTTSIITKSDESYSNAVKTNLLDKGGTFIGSAAELGWIKVRSNALISNKEHRLCDALKYKRMFPSDNRSSRTAKERGEILFTQKYVTFNDMFNLIENCSTVVRKMGEDECIGRIEVDHGRSASRENDIDFRWVKESGCAEFIVPCNDNSFSYLTACMTDSGWYNAQYRDGYYNGAKYCNLMVPHESIEHGEMTLKDLSDSKYYADYEFYCAPNGSNGGCTDGDIPMMIALHENTKVEYKNSFTKYTAKGIEIVCYHAKRHGRNGRWTVRVSDNFSPTINRVLAEWRYPNGDRKHGFPIYTAVKCKDGYTSADSMCDSHGWKRNMKCNRVIHKGDYNCIVYPDMMVFTTLLPIPTSDVVLNYKDVFKSFSTLKSISSAVDIGSSGSMIESIL